MSYAKKVAIFCLAFTFAFSFFNTNSFGSFFHDYSEHGYENPTLQQASVSKLQSSSLYSLIIEGTAHYIRSHSYYMAFLYSVEVSGFGGTDNGTYKMQLYYLDMAILEMEEAVQIFEQLIEMLNMSCNTEMRQALENFDYYGFGVVHSMNAPVFKRVTDYLRSGDAPGPFEESLENGRSKITKLKKIRKKLEEENDKGKDGVNSQSGNDYRDFLWSLSREYSESLLFSQYVSQVFAEITGNKSNGGISRLH